MASSIIKMKNKLNILQERPITRADCIDGPRPCPWASCRHNMLLEVRENGQIKFAYENISDPLDLKHSCVLDIVDKYKTLTLEEIGQLLGLTRERVRQIHDISVHKLRRKSVENTRKIDETKKS